MASFSVVLSDLLLNFVYFSGVFIAAPQVFFFYKHNNTHAYCSWEVVDTTVLGTAIFHSVVCAARPVSLVNAF